MKQIYLFIGLIVAALVIGFVVGQNVSPIERLKIVKEQVVDTVFRTQTIKIPVEKETILRDTVFVDLSDSMAIQTDITIDDTLVIVNEDDSDDSLQIKKDEKLKVETVQLVTIKPELTDTLLQKLLKVTPVKQNQMLIEYWESPINYKGYRLSKTKLILYGLNPLEASQMYRYENQYFLKTNALFYELAETTNFLPLLTVTKPEFIND